jgi:hypothetical protein
MRPRDEGREVSGKRVRRPRSVQGAQLGEERIAGAFERLEPRLACRALIDMSAELIERMHR